MIPLRATAVIDAPEADVIRALVSGATWRRAARALGGRAAAPLAELRTGDTIVLSGTGPMRTSQRWTVGIDAHGLPVFRSGGRRAGTVSLHTTAIGAGTLTRIDCDFPDIATFAQMLMRRRVLRACQLLLGIAAVVAMQPLVVVAGALIADGERGRTVLAARKAGGGPEAAKWELPGGKAAAGENEREALVRELREELGIQVEVADRLGTDVELAGSMVLRAYLVRATDEPAATEHDELRRLGSDELDSVDWLDADRELIPALRTVLAEQT
ncbi:MAG: NUDIX domain-containing protein [Actinomycetota bacterium]|nr:NUDIX domain-containing protein [Actinomycetota bacterium]